MRKLLAILTVLLAVPAFAQEFEISNEGLEFYDVIEWKGKGAMLMSRDPKGNTKQITLTLVGDENTSTWEQKFNPKNDNFYYIASDNARYVYFLDNLEMDQGKVYFSQLTSAGNIKSTSVNLGTALKKLGKYDYNDFELINVVVTDEALVHHFRYEDKGAKLVREFATFTKHNNFLAYAVELGSVSMNNKDEDIGKWDYIGFTGDKIYFAARDKAGKRKGWSIKEFSSKGQEGAGLFVDAPEDLISVENIGFGTTGKYYLEDKETMDKGLLAQINGKFYLVGGTKNNDGARLTLYELDGSEWKELNHMDLNYFIDKKSLKLGIYPMTEGIGYHLDHNGYDKASIITFDKAEKSAHNTFTDKSTYNPSSVFTMKEKEEFNVNLSTSILVFDTNQLNQEKPVIFVRKKK